MKSNRLTSPSGIETVETLFFDRIRRALGKAGPGRDAMVAERQALPPTDEDQRLLERTRTRSGAERLVLLADLKAAGERISMPVAVANHQLVREEIVRIIRDEISEWDKQKTVVAWDHPLIMELKLEASLAELQIPIYYGRPPDEIARKAFVGITAVDFCLADTGTLVMRTTASQPRTISLLPTIHMAIINPQQIIASLKELYALLQRDPAYAADGLTNCLTMITGPSKTADIEATMVHGAHGPRQVFLFVIDA